MATSTIMPFSILEENSPQHGARVPIKSEDYRKQTIGGPTIRSCVLFLNLISTIAGLVVTYTSNPSFNAVLGTFDGLKSAIRNGEINVGALENTNAWLDEVTDIKVVAEEFTFYQAPHRNIATMGVSFSKCDRIASDETLHSSVYWEVNGQLRGRRDLIRIDSWYLRSCGVVNVVNDYKDWFLNKYLPDSNFKCLNSAAGGCVQTALDIMQDLRENFASPSRLNRGDYDGGKNGAAILLCPKGVYVPSEKPAVYMVLQKPFYGATHHFEFQVSVCQNEEMANTTSNLKETSNMQVHHITGKDDNAAVYFAVPNWGLLGTTFLYFYGLLSLVLIMVGLANMFRPNYKTVYVHSKARSNNSYISKFCGFFSMEAFTWFSNDYWAEFESNQLFGSEVWMNNYMYLVSSYIYAFLTLRESYIVLEISLYQMLWGTGHWTVLIFMAGGMVRLCWASIAINEALCQLVGFCLYKAPRKIRDPVSVFLAMRYWISYKVEVFLLVLLVTIMIFVRGSTSFMVGRTVLPTGDRGPVTVSFWDSENFLDFVSIFSLSTLVNLMTMAVLMKFHICRDFVYNSVVQSLIRRYPVAGFDLLLFFCTLKPVYTTIEANDEDSAPKVLVTTCPVGDILHLFQRAGPPNTVTFEGENSLFPNFVYHERGVPRQVAIKTGLLQTKDNVYYKRHSNAVKRIKSFGQNKAYRKNDNPSDWSMPGVPMRLVQSELAGGHISVVTWKSTVSPAIIGGCIVLRDELGALTFVQVLDVMNGVIVFLFA